MSVEECDTDCVHAGNDSPSCLEPFIGYMKCLGAQMDPAASCDESCSGAEGCAGEAIAACEVERVAWETRFEECGTKTHDYEAPSVGCRRASACDSYAVECMPRADGTSDCQCFNFRPELINNVPQVSNEGDECLTAARLCQGL